MELYFGPIDGIIIITFKLYFKDISVITYLRIFVKNC